MGQTILEAALARGPPLSAWLPLRQLRRLQVRAARGRGRDVALFRIRADASRKKRSGLILACRAVPWSDCEVEVPRCRGRRGVHPSRQLDCEVASVDAAPPTTSASCGWRSCRGGPFDFSAGQYASVEFRRICRRATTRWRTGPASRLLEFHIRLMPGGAVTPYVASQLKLGDTVKVVGPATARRYLRDKHTGPILALAGGSGLAPIKSIVETALAPGAQAADHAVFRRARRARPLPRSSISRALAAQPPESRASCRCCRSPTARPQRRTGFLADAVAQRLRRRSTAPRPISPARRSWSRRRSPR